MDSMVSKMFHTDIKLARNSVRRCAVKFIHLSYSNMCRATLIEELAMCSCFQEQTLKLHPSPTSKTRCNYQKSGMQSSLACEISGSVLTRISHQLTIMEGTVGP